MTLALHIKKIYINSYSDFRRSPNCSIFWVQINRLWVDNKQNVVYKFEIYAIYLCRLNHTVENGNRNFLQLIDWKEAKISRVNTPSVSTQIKFIWSFVALVLFLLSQFHSRSLFSFEWYTDTVNRKL